MVSRTGVSNVVYNWKLQVKTIEGRLRPGLVKVKEKSDGSAVI